MTKVLLFLLDKPIETTIGMMCTYHGTVDGECFQAHGYPDGGAELYVFPELLEQAVKAAIAIVRQDGQFDRSEVINV